MAKKVESTRLRFISARRPEQLTQAVSTLPFKVEIKGSPVFARGRWYLYFVLPESPPVEMKNVELK